MNQKPVGVIRGRKYHNQNKGRPEVKGDVLSYKEAEKQIKGCTHVTRKNQICQA
jgi:hypothetical protein